MHGDTKLEKWSEWCTIEFVVYVCDVTTWIQLPAGAARYPAGISVDAENMCETSLEIHGAVRPKCPQDPGRLRDTHWRSAGFAGSCESRSLHCGSRPYDTASADDMSPLHGHCELGMKSEISLTCTSWEHDKDLRVA